MIRQLRLRWQPPPRPAPPAPSQPEAIKRIVFHEVPLGDTAGNTLKLTSGQEIAVMCPSSGSTLAAAVADALGQQFAVVPRIIDLSGQPDGFPPDSQAAPSLAGLVLVLDEAANAAIQDIKAIPARLAEFFSAMQQLVSSPDRKFCLLITRGNCEADPAAVVVEGVRGMFLDAALEYDSVLFRSVALDGDTDLEAGLKQALSLDHSLVEIRFHGQEAFTVEGHVQPLSLIDPPDFALNPGDVVVVSGGGKGITPHLAYALAPNQPRLVLLGSSEFDPEVDYDSLIATNAAPAGASPSHSGGRSASPTAQPDTAMRLASGGEIAQTLRELAHQGIEATYYSCDVNDPESVGCSPGPGDFRLRRHRRDHPRGRHHPGLLYGVYDRGRFHPGGGRETFRRLEPFLRRPGAWLAFHGHALFHYCGQGQRRPD